MLYSKKVGVIMLIYGKNILKEIELKKIKRAYCARKEYTAYLIKNHIKYDMVDFKYLDKLVNGVHQGIVLEVDDFEYSTVEKINGDFVVILDHLEDPHNFGAIIRTCACAGVSDIIIPKDRSVKVNETVIKVSAGTVDKLNIVMVSNLATTLEKLKKDGYFAYATDMNGKDYKSVDYSGKKILIIGNEGKGVSRLIKEKADEVVSIPMANSTESLNASVAAGILIFEMRD